MIGKKQKSCVFFHPLNWSTTMTSSYRWSTRYTSRKTFYFLSSYSWIVFPLCTMLTEKKNLQGLWWWKNYFPLFASFEKRRGWAGLGVPIVSLSNEWGETYYYTAHSMVLLASVYYILLFCLFFFFQGGKIESNGTKNHLPLERKEPWVSRMIRGKK